MTAVANSRAREPWTGAQLRLLAAFNAVGVVLLAAALWQSADEAELGAQVTWLNTAVLGVVLAAGADILWLTNGRRRLLQRRRGLLADVPPPPAALGSVATLSPAPPGSLVQLHGGSRAHRRACPLVVGKPVTVVDGPSLRAAGGRLRRCEVCRP